jgi:hypothetical protein
MHDVEWRHVPAGPDADLWATRPRCRTVLVVVHTVTSGQRLLEVVRLIGTDPRVQVVFTSAPDVFGAGVNDFLRATGGVVVPWLQATQTGFDLALAAGYGSISQLHSPLIVLPHGAGYGKRPAARADRSVTARSPYGLDPQRLMRDGRVIPAAIVLPHAADLTRLTQTCPGAADVATVIGDPCYDVLMASACRRSSYREQLAVGPERRLVVVTSTWGPSSLFGAGQQLLRKLLDELPSDEFGVVTLIHPNVWCAHGQWQVQAWLEDCRARGLGVVPPEADWRGVMIAADWILADHGSLGVYGTAVNVPLMVSTPASPDLDPSSAHAVLAAAAPSLRPNQRLLPQLRRAAAAYRPASYAQVAARISSEPGRFAQNMRQLMYRLLRLRPPREPPCTPIARPPFLIP